MMCKDILDSCAKIEVVGGCIHEIGKVDARRALVSSHRAAPTSAAASSMNSMTPFHTISDRYKMIRLPE